MHNKTKFISNGVKKILFVSCIALFFGLAPHALAQGFTALAPIPGLTDTSSTAVVNSTTLANFFNNLYKYLIGLAATLAVIEIIWGGLQISTQDSVSKQGEGRARIYQAILGLVLVLSPVLVFSIINPSILNLSLNLQPLNTATPGTPGTPGTPAAAAPTTDLTSGCQVTGGDYIKTAVCPTQAAAQVYSCPNELTTKIIPACKSVNPNTGLCDTGFLTYCSGKTLTAVLYHYISKSSFLGFSSITDNKIIQRDIQVVSSFTSGCAADGGKVITSVIANVFTCPADAAIPNYDANTYSGTGCNNETLTCTP